MLRQPSDMRPLIRSLATQARPLAIVAIFALAIATPRRLESRSTTDGAKLFASECARCHGRDGTGGRGPDLTVGTLRFASDDASLFRLIASGIPGSPMPGFMAGHSNQDLWQLVAYLRSLAPARVPTPDGDRGAGRALFDGRAACAACHLIDGHGGRRGPDLSEIGRLRTPAALRQAIVDPSPQASAAWRSLRVTYLDGRVITGRRLDEDTFSIRLLDDGGRLWNIERRRTRSIDRIGISTMPPYGAELSSADVNNLVAYLTALGN